MCTSPGTVTLDAVSYSVNGAAIIDGIDLNLEPGRITCLLGPSGCGKSTLLRLMGGLIEPVGGAVSIGGIPAREAWPGVAYVFQQPRLCPWRTVLGNVTLALELRRPRLSRPERERRAEGYLAAVGMEHAAGRFPGSLSGGEAQRVALARALTVESPVMLMDEPFASLDPAARRRLQNMLLAVQDEARRTVVFVTHDIDEAVAVGDEIVLLTPGPARVLTVLPGSKDASPGSEAEGLRARIRDAFGLSGETSDLKAPKEVAVP